MKVALVGPELEENLALRYVHAAVVAAGHEAEIFDFHAEEQVPELVAGLLAYRPRVIGLSMVFTARAGEYVRLTTALRRAGYTGHITAGGHFASLHAEQLLQDASAITSVLHGEGERALVDLVSHMDSPWAVAGITCRDARGQLVHNQPRPPLDDLDALVFPTRPEHFHQYFGRPIANILSGRGCFANCDFCSINAWHRVIGGRRFRQRSVENLTTEMAELYHRRGVRIFNFHDDNFFLPSHRQNVERFTAIQGALAEHGVGRIAIQVKARPDSVEPESMAILKEIGLFRVFLGVESNAVAGLKALGRGIERAQNHFAVELLKHMDLHVTFNLLMFEPECTIADLRENIRFIVEQAEVPLNFCRTEVYGGTALEARLRAAGRLEGDYFGYGYTMSAPRSQAAYELFREVFTPRNFHYDGMNLLAMSLDYHLHLLRHFYPGAGGDELVTATKGFIRELNTNNAELLERICAFVESSVVCDAGAVSAFAAALSAERAAFDEGMKRRSRQLLQTMRHMATPAKSPQGRRRPRYAAAVVVASALFSDCHHSTEMAPAGNTAQAAGATQSSPHSTEMAPEAPRPRRSDSRKPPTTRPATTRPTSRPTSRSAVKQLPAADAAKVEKALESPTFRGQLARIGKKYKMVGEVVEAELTIGTGGKVAGVTVHLPTGKPKALRAELVKAAKNWRFQGVKGTGECTVDLELGEVVRTYPTEMAPRGWGTHMDEMVPIPPPSSRPS